MNKKLADQLIGDLGPAMRHIWRLQTGELTVTPGLLQELQRSIENCVERIQLNHDPKDWSTE